MRGDWLMLRPEIEKIIKKHLVDDASFEIFEPLLSSETAGTVLLRTEKENPELVKELEDYLNRNARAFGLEGPFRARWERLPR